MWFQSLGWADPLEEEMITHSWKITWTVDSGELPSVGSQRVGRDWATELNWTEEFSAVCCDSHSQRLWHSQKSSSRCFSGMLLLFLMIQWLLGTWSLVLLPFLNPAWTSGSSQFTYCWSLAWRILSITVLACEIKASGLSYTSDARFQR